MSRSIADYVDAVPFRTAVLCESCQNISEAPYGHCAICGSEALLNLAKILNREVAGTPRLTLVRDRGDIWKGD